MKSKVLIFALCLVVFVTAGVLLTAYNNESEPELKIVFIGDSIGEALAGPSPLSERERYGYYGVIGQRNGGYTFVNRAIGGDKTADLLTVLKSGDSGATMRRSHIQSADIIHVSILGNDFLLEDLNTFFRRAAKDDFSPVEGILQTATDNIKQIVERIKELNPDAFLMFQNVYNPFYPGTSLLTEETVSLLLDEGFTFEQMRGIGHELLNKLNGILNAYLEENPGAFVIIDIQEEFERIHKEDPERGARLIYSDWVHPSSEGHAVMADAIQKVLEENKLANGKQAVKRYKDLRIEQLERMFSHIEGFDVSSVKSEINNAKTCEEITKIYFKAILGKTPVYGNYVSPIKDEDMTWFDEDVVFEFSTKSKFGIKQAGITGLPLQVIFKPKSSSITLKADGTAKITATLNDFGTALDSLQELLGISIDLGAMLTDENGDPLDLEGLVQSMISTYVPGITLHDLDKTLGLFKDTLGLEIKIDRTDPATDELLDYIEEHGTLPKEFTIPNGIVFEYTAKYNIVEMEEAYNGKKYTAIYLNQECPRGEPFVILSLSETKEGKRQVTFKFDMLDLFYIVAEEK